MELPGSNAPRETVPHPAAHKVPEELLQHLREVESHLHSARESLEKVMNDFEYNHQDRIDEAAKRFREAQAEVEKASRDISDWFQQQTV